MKLSWFRSIRVPLIFSLATFIGLCVASLFPGVAEFVAVPSVPVLKGRGIIDYLTVPVSVATYSLFPLNIGLWWNVIGAILLMSLVLRWRLTGQEYVLAFLIGAVAGGIVFIATAPRAALLGPVPAGYGLIGFYCVSAARNWRGLHWAAKSYSLLVFAVLPYVVVRAVLGNADSRFVEAAAFVTAFAVGMKVLRDRRALPTESVAESEP
ncbi:MAG: hypothetical protein WEE89_01950 [Gemmatimonadota bacterium]